MKGFLCSGIKENCYGCEACAQICPQRAITMQEDKEGFRYPIVDDNACIHCGRCATVCPFDRPPDRYADEKYTFGGYHSDPFVRAESTSGGAFSAIVEAFCDEGSLIYGAVGDGLTVKHIFVDRVSDVGIFRKSKYMQSEIGTAYSSVKKHLNAGRSVLFSGTPCQIAGLRNYLGRTDMSNLLTIEVVCEGVPSPWYVRNMDAYFFQKYGAHIENLDYRFKDARPKHDPKKAKWDFEVMRIQLQNGKTLKKDRWFNPFWSIWLAHLMSRPSCYRCQFATSERIADITLGDLWGVHLYCPELYGKNTGCSLVVCNTEKGRRVFSKAQKLMFGHVLDFETALKYQSPMRKHIDENSDRSAFMLDLLEKDHAALTKKWAKKPTLKLLWSKYIWGNRQKIFLWNLMNKFCGRENKE